MAGPNSHTWRGSVDIASPTEERNPRTCDIDLLATEGIVERITAEDAVVTQAVRSQTSAISQAVDIAVNAIRAGGRVHYAGAGTSGRIGVLDAVELMPTYGVGREWFVAHLAGGMPAMVQAVEGAEDDAALGRCDLDGTDGRDVIVGLAASGRTPYVAGAFEKARERGAATVLVSANPSAPLAATADIAILPDTGPEVITGSTRMKAATAQKLVLNTFSTAVMVRLGKTYSNLMIDVRPTNLKLRARLIRLLTQATGRTAAECESLLAAAHGNVRVALVMALTGASPEDCRRAVATLPATESIRDAIGTMSTSHKSQRGAGL